MIEFQDWRPQIDKDADTNKSEALPLHLFWSLRRLASETGDLIRYDKTNMIRDLYKYAQFKFNAGGGKVWCKFGTTLPASLNSKYSQTL